MLLRVWGLLLSDTGSPIHRHTHICAVLQESISYSTVMPPNILYPLTMRFLISRFFAAGKEGGYDETLPWFQYGH